MKSTVRSKKAAGILVAVIACVVLTGGWASAQQAAGLTAVGGADPANGYPKWYIDGNGLQLAPCLDTTAADPCGLAGAIPDPASPISFPNNFPEEFFYWLLNAKITGIGARGAGTALLANALEGAFGGPTGTPADGAGAQIVFARFRFRVNGGLTPGATYTLTGPLGSRAFVADAAGAINFTDDRGCGAAPPACDFSLALLQPNVGPFLTWDAAAPAPPAGFIGDPAIDHTITGSPFGNNLFQISGPDVGGPGVSVVQTNVFSLMGKIFVRPATTTTLTSTPNPSTAGQAVTLTAAVAPVAPATGVPAGTVTFSDGGTTIGTATLDATGSASIVVSTLANANHSLTAAYGGSLDFLASTSAAVTQVVNGETATTLTTTPNPSTVEQAVTLTATVAALAPATGVPAGTVTFKDGAATIGTATLDATGRASIVVSTLANSNHSLTAVYGGGGNFLASTSAAVTQVVNAETTTTLTTSPNPSSLGQAVTLTATVAPVAPGTGVPTGTVTFRDGDTTIGTATLDATGSASIIISTFTAASHSLTAAYGGGGNFLASTSAAVTQVVNGATTTTLTTSPNPSTVGQAVTLTATVAAVAPATGVPTGTVTFKDGATAIGTATLGATESTSITVSTFARGSHSLTAVYGGSPDFQTSTSAAVTQVVNAETATTLTATPNPSRFGQAVTLTATVALVVPATGTPTGSVRFMDGAATIGTATLGANGSASIVVSTLATGSHSLTAAYGGAGNFLASTSTAVTQVVNAGDTTTTLTATPNPSRFGQAVTLTATVAAVAPAAGVPTGTVTFSDGAATIGTATLGATGSASIVVSTLAASSHSLTAAYGGSGNFLTSASAAVTQVVNAGGTTTTLTATPNPSTTGQAVTLTATVVAVAPAAGVPAGTVTFSDGAATIGTATLGANGSASIVVSTLAAGSHSLTAAYGGSGNFLASTSAAVTQVVNAPDTVSVTRAEQVLQTGELRVEGVNTRITGDGFAASVSIFSGGAVGTTCPGTLIATTPVSAADGRWAFRGVIALRPTTVCVKSAGGGVGTRAVDPK